MLSINSDVPSPTVIVYPHYPFPIGLAFRLAVAIIIRRQVDFALQARRYVSRIEPPVEIIGEHQIPRTGPCLLTINHYSRPGFRSWWLALSVSATVPLKVHWVMTNAWTYPDKMRASILTPITNVLFPQIARCLDFSAMPPMPPRPQDLAFRAQTVRHVLRDVQQVMQNGNGAQLMIGLAPEGGDMPGGVLAPPPPGVGRFIEHLTCMGLKIAPVGIFEENGCLHLNFGSQYQLSIPPGLAKRDRDREVSKLVMERIAALVPEELGYRYR